MSAARPTQERVVSSDGTRIGFLREGSGPGLVLVQGAMGTAYNFRDLARALSDTFTIYRPDRRGRGLSPKPYDFAHRIGRDVEDIKAVLDTTGATRVFGLSSGAVITLEAARALPQISAAAVYEPPFYATGISQAGIRRLHAEIERGALPSALVTALRTAQTAPAPLRALPRPIARIVAAAVLSIDGRRSSEAPHLRDLLPGIRYDFDVVASRDTQLKSYAILTQPLLLLSGTKSPEFLRQGVRRLHQILPHSQRVELNGLDHSGPWNTGRHDDADRVAKALCEFFKANELCDPG